MATNQQLDAVLFFLKNITAYDLMSSRQTISIQVRKNHPELKFSELLLNDILIKLKNDKYVNNPHTDMYNLSADGRNFKGYVWANKWYVKWFSFSFKQALTITIIGGVIVGLIVWAITKENKSTLSKEIKQQQQKHVPNQNSKK